MADLSDGYQSLTLNKRDYWLVPKDQVGPLTPGITLQRYDSEAFSDIAPYEYENLKHDNKRIRLLELESSTRQDTDIHCELVEADFDNAFRIPTKARGSYRQPSYRTEDIEEYLAVKAVQIEYEALSWCWGVGKPEYAILIKKGPKRFKKAVTKDLALALKYLRHKDTTRTLWIDALCINQKNFTERNHQVQMMSHVYTKANQVCVWLGEESVEDESKMAIDFIREEIVELKGLDALSTHPKYLKKWKAFLLFMQRAWFSRRWVVQEIALSRYATLYCGPHSLPWKDFAVAVQLFVEVETANRRLSEAMRRDEMLRHVPGLVDHVSHLGASLLVKATDSVIRSGGYQRELPGLSHFRNPKTTIDGLERTCLLSLEHLVSTMFVFQASEPRDMIYSLLAIASDAAPASAEVIRPFSLGRTNPLTVAEKEDLTFRICSPILTEKPFVVDYNRSYSDVCRDFVEFSLRRKCESNPAQALDIICRPWALDQPQPLKKSDRIKKDGSDNPPEFLVGKSSPDDLPLPSWVAKNSKAPFSLQPHPGTSFTKMVRVNADPLVGLAVEDQGNYDAAQGQKVDWKEVYFRKRQELNHYSLYVRGFDFDEVIEVTEPSQEGYIPKAWLDLVSWADHNKDPPDEFWRTLVADRRPGNRTPPKYYATACKECFVRGSTGSGQVDTNALIDSDINPIVAEFCRRVQAVIWNRSLFRTKNGSEGNGRLGLATGVRKGDKICVVYGCTVPVILRSHKKMSKDFEEENTTDRRERCLAVVRKLRQAVKRRRMYGADTAGHRHSHEHKRLEEIRKRASDTPNKRLPSVAPSFYPESSKKRRKTSQWDGETDSSPESSQDSHQYPNFKSQYELAFDEFWLDQKAEYYSLVGVGECYLHGMMDGQAYGEKFQEEIPDRHFEIR